VYKTSRKHQGSEYIPVSLFETSIGSAGMYHQGRNLNSTGCSGTIVSNVLQELCFSWNRDTKIAWWVMHQNF